MQVSAATSSLALRNPFYADITFDTKPLSKTGGFTTPAAFTDLIFDSHVDSEDRLERLIAFVSRLIAPYSNTSINAKFGCTGGVLDITAARGIGIGLETALLVKGSASGAYSGQRVTNVSTKTESAFPLYKSVDATGGVLVPANPN